MGHPYKQFRQGNVERSRVGAITGEPKSMTDSTKDTPVLKKGLGSIGGDMAAMRMDRPQRASGGKVSKKGGTTVVNVITGGQQQPAPPPMIPPGAMPPGPPPGPPPGAMPPPGAGGPPPGLGGPPGGPPMPMRARGGGVKAIGMKVGTKVQHSEANTDPKNMNRKRVVTFNTGGGVKTFMAGGAVKGVVMKGGTPSTADKGSKLPGGAGGGEGRLAKARKA